MKSIKHVVADAIPRDIVLRIKYVYQSILRLLRGKTRIITDYEYEIIKIKGKHSFFGYYDLSPFNPYSSEIVYLSYKDNDKKVDIILRNLENGSERIVGQSSSWNWQQGIRLRWMPNNSREIVFNDYESGKYISRIVNVDTSEIKTIHNPMYDISKDGAFGLSIDFGRLGIMRPGYGYICNQYEEKSDIENEGIYLVDIINDSANLLISYDQISNLFADRVKSLQRNYINHLSFSPNGKKFLFFWLTKNERLHDADMLVYDFTTRQLSIIERDFRVSHYVWENDENIICTSYDDCGKCAYYRYNISAKTRELLSHQILNNDGHPSMLNDKSILTDTYPDLSGYQELYVADIETQRRHQLLSVYSNCRFEGERRTDLHPRINMNNNLVCIDVNHRSKREMLILKIE